MHNKKYVCTYFIPNLSKKAKSNHLIALPPVFTLDPEDKDEDDLFSFLTSLTLLQSRERITRIDDLEYDQF